MLSCAYAYKIYINTIFLSVLFSSNYLQHGFQNEVVQQTLAANGFPSRNVVTKCMAFFLTLQLLS
jgi:hypothetical protein